MRSYAIFKHSFGFEPHLKQITNTRYRNAIIKVRVRSHSLAIERGGHLETSVQERLCNVCNVIEDEKQFLFELDNSVLNINIRIVIKSWSSYLKSKMNNQLHGFGNSCIICFAWGKSIVGKGVSPTTRIILCIMFIGYLNYLYTLCHTASYHLLDYHTTTDCDNSG